jgi:MFS family permease
MDRPGGLWAMAGLVAVVLGAAGLALVWVFRVPVFQSPDEPLHFDYALAVYEHGGWFRAVDYPPPANHNRYENVYTHDYVHPYTNFLLDFTSAGTIAFNPAAKVSPDYGSADYFRRLDRAAPPDTLAANQAPFLARLYPFGYYGALAGWVSVVRLFGSAITVLFFGARVFSVLLLCGSLVLIYATARQLNGGRVYSLLLTAAIGFFPLTSFVASYVQPDNLSLFLTCFCYYLALRTRAIVNPAGLALLGAALGALLLTKVHFYVAVAVPVAAMLAGEWWTKPVGNRWRGLAAALLFAPSLAAGLLYVWTLGGANVLYQPPPLPARWLPHLWHWTWRALHEYYVGLAHQSFWGIFGWLDAPLVVHDAATTRGFRVVLNFGTFTLVGLSFLRLGQVSWRLTRLAARGRRRLAWRIACSNPVLNSYFLFTAIMVFLYVRLQNAFGAQGRNWLPLLLPIFLTATSYAPKVFRHRRGRALGSAAVLAALLLFDVIGSYFALETIERRYYAPFHGRPVALASVSPPSFEEGQPIRIGLDRPQFVYGVRLRYTLTNRAMSRAALQVCWQCENRDLAGAEKKATLHIIPGREPRTMTVCVNDTVDQFSLVPGGGPCRFELHEIMLLQPPEPETFAEGR